VRSGGGGGFRWDMIWSIGFISSCRGLGVVVDFLIHIFSERGFFRGVGRCLCGNGTVCRVVPLGEGVSGVFAGELVLDWVCGFG